MVGSLISSHQERRMRERITELLRGLLVGRVSGGGIYLIREGEGQIY
jgi:hypothetical protein